MKNALILYACCLLQLTFSSQATTRYVDAGSTNPVPPFTAWNTAATNIQAAIGAAFSGDTVLVTNGLYNSGGASVSGESNRVYTFQAITISSVNGPSVTTIAGSNNVRCAYLATGVTLSGFTLTNGHSSGVGSGAFCENTTATLTNCILAGNVGGGGVYRGTLRNCVLSNNITGGAGGGGASFSTLIDCRLINNSNPSHSAGFAGGAYSCLLTNCVVSGNSSGYIAGGAYQSTLVQCIVSDNQADSGAGGADTCTLINCVVVRNSGVTGVAKGTAFNSIIYYNTNGVFPSYGNFTNCCVDSLLPPVAGANNITNEPLFLDLAAGNLELQSNSPCINSGDNAYRRTSTDFTGSPRVAGAMVDIGPYEFQSPSSILSYAWAQQYGIATDGSADYVDPDGDEFNNWQEWMAGTIPTNQESVVRMFSPSNDPSGLVIRWQSVTGKKYSLQRSTDLAATPAFENLQFNIDGQAVTTASLDTTATNGGPYFYRVRVQPTTPIGPPVP